MNHDVSPLMRQEVERAEDEIRQSAVRAGTGAAAPVISNVVKEVGDNLRRPAQEAVEAVKDATSDAASAVKEDGRSAAISLNDQARTNADALIAAMGAHPPEISYQPAYEGRPANVSPLSLRLARDHSKTCLPSNRETRRTEATRDATSRSNLVWGNSLCCRSLIRPSKPSPHER